HRLCKVHYVEFDICYVIMFRTMSNTWVTDIRHFLDSEGNVIREHHGAWCLAQYFCLIIEAVTGRSVHRQDRSTGVQCRRRPGHKPCEGIIIADFYEQDAATIPWGSHLCGDNGYIRGWQETPWDKRPR